MIEIFNILIFTFFISLLFFLPIFKELTYKGKKIISDAYDLRAFNIIIICNLILIFTLLNFNISQTINIFYSIIFIFIIYFLTNFKKLRFSQSTNYYFLFFFIVLFILTIDLSNTLTFFWDTQKIWFPKAIILYNGGSISDLQTTSYNHYSFLGSILWAFFWKISSFEQEYFGRIFFLAIYCFAFINFLTLIKIKKKIKIILFLFFILITYDYWHFRGTQEILVFSFLLILSKYLYKIITEKDKSLNLVFIFLSLNLIIWTKNEGIILSLILISILFIFLKANLKFKSILLLITLGMIAIRFLSFKIHGIDTSLSNDFDFSNIISIFLNNLNLINILLITKYIIISFLKFPHIILSLFFAFVICFNKSLFRKILFLYFYLLISLLLIFVIYLSSPGDIEFMVSTGSLRLMFEFSSPYLLFILIFFKEKFKI